MGDIVRDESAEAGAIRPVDVKPCCGPLFVRTMSSIIAVSTMAAVVARGGEWPQILGPHRNGQADGERLVASWPAGGPPVRWQHPVGAGLAGIAVAGERAVVFHRRGARYVVEARDARSGEPLWRKEFPASYVSTISEDNGPRCVPLIDRRRVFLYSPEGNLRCVSLADGSTIWSREAFAEFRAAEGYFGAGSSPMVVDDKLLVNVGGRGAGLVAFSVEDGKTLWQVTDEQASYSAPTLTTIDGVRHAIFVTRLNVVSLDPSNGHVRFRFPFGQRGPTVNACTPLVVDGHLFVSASYGVGAVYAAIKAGRADIVWSNDRVMSSQYTTCVRHQGYFYGIDGRQDVGAAALRCFDPKTGKVMWTEEGFGYATLILADGKLLIMKTDGELVLARPSPEAYRRLDSVRVFSSTARALPALAEGKLFVRDTSTLKCLDLGAK